MKPQIILDTLAKCIDPYYFTRTLSSPLQWFTIPLLPSSMINYQQTSIWVTEVVIWPISSFADSKWWLQISISLQFTIRSNTFNIVEMKKISTFSIQLSQLQKLILKRPFCFMVYMNIWRPYRHCGCRMNIPVVSF